MTKSDTEYGYLYIIMIRGSQMTNAKATGVDIPKRKKKSFEDIKDLIGNITE